MGPAANKENTTLFRIHALEEEQRQEQIGQIVDLP